LVVAQVDVDGRDRPASAFVDSNSIADVERYPTMAAVTALSFCGVRAPDAPPNEICTTPSLKTMYSTSLLEPFGRLRCFTNASFAPGTVTGAEPALRTASRVALKSDGE
jgi:hypothetical protein